MAVWNARTAEFFQDHFRHLGRIFSPTEMNQCVDHRKLRSKIVRVLQMRFLRKVQCIGVLAEGEVHVCPANHPSRIDVSEAVEFFMDLQRLVMVSRPFGRKAKKR